MHQHQALKRLTMALFAFIVILPSVFAQDKVTISGRVLDETGYPMIGAGVIQLGTNDQVGTITDLDGNYSLQVPAGSTVEFRMIGYKFVIRTVTADETYNVQLYPDTEMIEETVVVGYGVQKKSDLTGSISQVKGDDMLNRTITSAGQALQGKTAGVSVFSSSAAPGSSPTIRIRGISSNGDSDPLYVVDGRITDDISGIDPNDIESMEVLKDAASAAIYGAQAGNGVVLITTRKGKGDGKINYSYQLTAQSLSKVPKVMNAEQFAQFYIEAERYTTADIFAYWDGVTNTDWIDYSFETSIMQHHNLSFSSGDEKGSVYVSLSYLYNDGMFVGDADTYERLTGMINANKKIKSWLEITTNNQIEYYRTRSVSEGSDYGSAILAALVLDPLTPTTYTADNLPDFMQKYLDNGYSLLTDENGNYYAVSAFNTSENVNPRIMRDRSYSKTVGFNLNGSSAINFTPVKGLVFTSRLGYRLSSYDVYGYSHDYYANTNAYQNYVGLNGTVGDSMYYQWENFLNYSKEIKKHTISAMVGMSYSQNRTNYIYGSYSGSDDDLGVEVDDPLFYYFAYATSSATKSVSGSEPTYTRKLSYFGRVGWNYLSKYYLQASLRADAADLSILPWSKHWGYFPSVSGGWTISEEPFFDTVKNVVEYAKIRVSWGQNGSISGLSDYAYANTIASLGNYATSTSTATYSLAYAPTTAGNTDLKWETSEQLDFGLDLRFLRGRLTFSGDWYKKKTKDLIVTGITASTVVGIEASPVNAGNVENTGVELELGWKDQIGDFSYSITANASTLKNEVTYVHESLSDGIDGETIRTYGTVTRFEMGYPAWHFYGYKFTGIDSATGDATFEDLDGSGSITDADKTDLGSGIPDLSYGITLNAAWKGFDATVFMTGTAGSQIFMGLDAIEYARNKLSYFYDDRWTSENTNAKTPAANASNWTQYLTSSGVVFSGNYFKIKQIQLGYTIPARLTKKVKIDNFRVYVSLDDFFTITDYPGFDPEVTGVGSSLGVDLGTYPTSKKMVFGVNVSF